jgi:activator-of-BECN1-regulated-autophagy protein 1
LRPPHPLSVITAQATYADMTRKAGRYVPHVVTVSLETAPLPDHCGVPRSTQMTSVANGYRPRLGQLLEACPLDGTKASAVTCVKFAPSSDFCLLGYGVREPLSSEGESSQFHPVTALYRVRGGMTHVSTMLSGDDDVNIARFHPDSGYGFVYGTKQGRVRILSPRPWNYYNSL